MQKEVPLAILSSILAQSLPTYTQAKGLRMIGLVYLVLLRELFFFAWSIPTSPFIKIQSNDFYTCIIMHV